jgi:Fic family protein
MEFKYDLDLFKSLLEAKELYGRYSTILEVSAIKRSLLLKPLMFQEAYKSVELAGSNIPQSSLYYLAYLDRTYETEELYNYFGILQAIEEEMSDTFNLTVGYLNDLHKSLFQHKDMNLGGRGKYRQKVKQVGKRRGISEVDFVPVDPIDIPIEMVNFIKYFNKRDSIDVFIDIALSHAQFESIHPYNDGNGRLGRLLIPLQAFKDSKLPFCLFLSHQLKQNEYSYYQSLKDFRNGKTLSYVKFFVAMLNKQLRQLIDTLEESMDLYDKDQKTVVNAIKAKNGYRVYDYLFGEVTTTIKEASKALQIDYQTMRHYIMKLHNLGLLAKEKIANNEYVYTYIKLYNIHVPIDWI